VRIAVLWSTLVVAATVAGCAKVEEDGPSASREVQATYVAARIIPQGKTVRAAVADGSIIATEVPGDVISDEALADTKTVECLVVGRAVPSGTLLRRSMFVNPESLGIDTGLTDGTTVDDSC